MKVHTIEIAAAIEEELKTFLKEWGGDYPMRFTRFIDLGGLQTDLHVYPAAPDAPAWLVIRIKSIIKSDQGECIQYFVDVLNTSKSMESVMVSPEVWKLPAMASKILEFVRGDMLVKIGEDGNALEGGDAALSGGSQSSPSGNEEDEDYEDLDTAGILAGDGAGGESDFNPEDVIAQANNGDGGEEADPSDLIKQMNEEADQAQDDDNASGFNPEDVIKD